MKIIDFNVAIGMNYGIASFASWLKSLCNLETCITRIGEPPLTIASF